jgi:uncharacterized RDD family membrane protein YckC
MGILMNTSHKGKRLGNFIVDMIIILVIISVFQLGIYFLYPEIADINSISMKILTYSIWFLYYFLFEKYTNKTIGKMLTKTIIVDNEGNKPSTTQIFIRSVIRLIPFEALTYLYGLRGLGLHDLISKTKVVDSIKLPSAERSVPQRPI